MRNLTDKQERFVELVVGGLAQSDAYRQVYNTKAKPKVVARKASEELKKPHVNMRYQYLLDKARAEASTGAVMNAARILECLSEIAEGKTEYADYQYDGDLGRDMTLMRRPGTRERLKALELLGKHEGLFTEKLEVEDSSLQVSLTVTDKVDEEEKSSS